MQKKNTRIVSILLLPQESHMMKFHKIHCSQKVNLVKKAIVATQDQLSRLHVHSLLTTHTLSTQNKTRLFQQIHHAFTLV